MNLSKLASTILMGRVKFCGLSVDSEEKKLNYLVFTCHKCGILRGSSAGKVEVVDVRG